MPDWLDGAVLGFKKLFTYPEEREIVRQCNEFTNDSIQKVYPQTSLMQNSVVKGALHTIMFIALPTFKWFVSGTPAIESSPPLSICVKFPLMHSTAGHSKLAACIKYYYRVEK